MILGWSVKFTHEGADHTYTVRPANILAFEDEFNMGLAQAFSGDQMRLKYLYWLCWECLRANGTTVKPFKEWVKSLDHAELAVDDDNPFDPTA